MPTYRNVTKTIKTIDGKVINPEQTVHSFVYYDEDQVQLLKLSDNPYYNPIILSEKIEEDKTIILPRISGKSTKYSIHFYVEEGEVDIRFNSIKNIPALLLYPKSKWNLRCFERVIDNINIKGLTKKFKLWLIVEKI